MKICFKNIQIEKNVSSVISVNDSTKGILLYFFDYRILKVVQMKNVADGISVNLTRPETLFHFSSDKKMFEKIYM